MKYVPESLVGITDAAHPAGEDLHTSKVHRVALRQWIPAARHPLPELTCPQSCTLRLPFVWLLSLESYCRHTRLRVSHPRSGQQELGRFNLNGDWDHYVYHHVRPVYGGADGAGRVISHRCD